MNVVYKIVKSLAWMSMVFLTLASASCSDDLDGIKADVVMPDETNLMELEKWSYKIPFQVASDSKWKIEIDGDLCYAFPEEGEGNATVTLAVIDNMEEERQHGELRIVFPEDPSQNKVFTLEQKWAGDYDDNAATIGRGNSVYAVGYGYDATNGFADPNSVKNAILKFDDLAEDGTINYGSQQSKEDFQTYSGSNVSDISNDLQTKAGISGGSCGFKGEINASFNSKDYVSNKHEYALTYYNLIKERIKVDADISELRSKDCMTTRAYNAINGLSETYGNTREGYKKLIENYGTHMPKNANLGGRIRHSLTVDISKITSEYDINAFASASYKNAFVNTSASVDEKYSKSYESNINSCTIKITTYGGSTSAINNLLARNGFTEANVKAWVNSLTDDNLALVGFDNEDLIPLYELVDQTKYPQRYKALKAYMEGNQMLEDFPPIETAFQCGTISKITVPSFDSNGTLIKEARIDNHVIAQICNEYIPMINKSERITVIYPVIDNRPCYNMGYFIGNSSHRPCRVSWSGKNVTIKEYDQSPIGVNSVLYLRGATFTTSTEMKPNSIATAKIEGSYMAAPDICISNPADGKYPLVKIFDRIWTRTNYRGRAASDGSFCKGWWSDSSQSDGYTLYIARLAQFPPIGWEVPKSKDYQSIIDYLQANDVTGSNIGKSFLKDGALGYRTLKFNADNDEVNYWTSDAGNDPNMIRIRCDQGTISIIPADKSSIDKRAEDRNVGKHYPVRFVKKL